MKSLLLLPGAGKFGKLLTTGGTMLLSVAAFALVYGWRSTTSMRSRVREADRF